MATSPSGSPTCATSARGPSPPCSGWLRRGFPTSPSRASSSRRTSHRPRRPPSTARSSSASSPRRAVGPATRRSSRPSWASRRSCSSPGPPTSRPARRSRSTATPARSPSPPTSLSSRHRSCAVRSGPTRWRPAAGPGSPATAPTWRCSPTSVVCRTPRPPARSTSRAWGCSAPSSSSCRPTRHRRSTTRRRSTERCSRPSAAGVWSSARWTPGPTSRSPSPTSARRRTRPWADEVCACRPSVPSCSTPSSRRSPWPPGTPAPTCG